jgi:hypothetical protein
MDSIAGRLSGRLFSCEVLVEVVRE